MRETQRVPRGTRTHWWLELRDQTRWDALPHRGLAKSHAFGAALLLALACLCWPSPAAAHNDAIAVAYPMDAITIDGKLDDWPEDLPTSTAERAKIGDSPGSGQDLSCRFRVGYSPDALYVAVEVADDSKVLDPNAGNAWDTQDGCSVYLDLSHRPDRSVVQQYFQCGDELRVYGFEASRENVEVATNWSESGRSYEWRIRLESPLAAGGPVGFDVDVTDKDDDGSFTWMAWGEGSQKAYFPGRTGDLFLLPPGQQIQLGHVNGQVRWLNSSAEGQNFPQVSIESLTSPRMWAQVDCDDSGSYSASLPAGSYLVHVIDTIELRVAESDHVHTQIEPGQKAAAGTLHVKTLPPPGLVNAEGLLHQDEINTAEIDRFVQAHLEYLKIPGISIAIVKDGEIIYRRGLGVKNRITREAVTETTLFEAASMTKPLFALAVCRLAERGVLDLDRPLYKYLPYPDIEHDQRYKLITARMVLCHRTGFPNWRDHLLNGSGDESMMSTVLYSHIARQHIPAPKANFVRVIVNGEDWGVYTNVQQFNKEFLKENYGGDKGARWKVSGSPQGGGGLDYRGDDPADYRQPYEQKSGGKKSLAKLIELCRVLEETPTEKLPKALEPIVDVDELLWFLAIDIGLINSDGYWIRASDYCIFLDEDNRFHFIPHDMNEAFRGAAGPGFGGRGGPGRGRRGREAERDTDDERGRGAGGPAQMTRSAIDGSQLELDPLIGLDDPSKPLRSKVLAVPKYREQYLRNVRELAAQSLDWNRCRPGRGVDRRSRQDRDAKAGLVRNVSRRDICREGLR